ncbi:MAG: hypothetical protein WD076_08115, partial [Parvularculaceae bacterium]
LVRSTFDGSSYEWGLAIFNYQFSGAGLGGDFWFLIVQAMLAIAMLYPGFRSPGALSYLLLAGWLGLNAASFMHGYLADPEALMFHGDTLGVHVNIGLFAVALFGGALLAAIAAAFLELGGGRKAPRFAWTRANTIALLVALAPLPVQYFLLSRSSGQETGDQIGVILTMAQWAAIVFALGLDRKKSL